MKVRQRLRRACVRHYTGKGWRDRGTREGRMERETDTERERKRNEGTKERRGGREVGRGVGMYGQAAARVVVVPRPGVK